VGKEAAKDDAFVLLGHAPSQAIAGLWASMLEEAGIVAYMPGAHLADGWASWQQTIGNIGSDVLVPRSRLEEARRVIQEEDGAAGTSQAQPEPSPRQGSTKPLIWTIVVMVVIVVVLILTVLADQLGDRPHR
jgi:hypothetical protein